MQNLVLCNSFQNKIEIYEKNYSKFLYCLVREHKILLNNEPEEFIRQCLLYYLINISNLYPNSIDIKVEFNNADIVVFPCLPNDFQPFLPIAIIETKVNVNLEPNIYQLKGYLSEFRCKIGFLFDGNKLVHYENDRAIYLSGIENLKEIIKNNIDKIFIEKEYQIFLLAKSGDLNSFNILTKKFPYGRICFEYINKGIPIIQCGIFFSFDDKEISFRISGNYTKLKQKIKVEQFVRVISFVE